MMLLRSVCTYAHVRTRLSLLMRSINACESLQDELHTHSKSSNKFLEQQAFLKQAEASEHEQTKAARQAAQRR